MNERRIEKVELKVSELNFDFGNPRKISRKDREKLEDSLEQFGDFGLIVIDENNSVIAGNQRVTIMKEKNPDTVVLCKRLVGYSKPELRAINIKDNTHEGTWDLDMLAEWTADLNVDFGIEEKHPDPNDRKISDMELIRYEKYDYVMIVCRNEADYKHLIQRLGIEGKKVAVCKTRKIRARAIWYDDMKCQIVDKKDAEEWK